MTKPKISRIVLHKFRISGMHDSSDVARVRRGLGAIPDVTIVNANLRKMQVEVTATNVIEVTQLRSALADSNCTLSDLTVSARAASQGLRNDEPEEA
jgi:Heavy-metal-associated domain